jgi:general secretion pathway protein J
MCRRRSRHPGSQPGFTLLELLVAITLLGLIATMAFSGLRLGTRAWETAAEQDHEIYLVQQMLRTRLDAAHLLTEFDLPPEGTEPFFEGRRNRLSFLTVLPDLFGVAGLHRVTLEVEGTEGGRRDLVLSWQLWRPGTEGPAPAPDDDSRRVLLDGIEAAEFTYFGFGPDYGGRPRWQQAWRGRADLPSLVRIEVEKPGSPWPSLVVAPQLGQAVHW